MPGIDPPPTDRLASMHVRVLEVAAERLAQQLGARDAPTRSARAACDAPGTSSASPRCVHREHLLERGDLHLVDTHRAGDRMPAELRDEVGPAQRRCPPAGPRAACHRENVTRSAPSASASATVGSSARHAVAVPKQPRAHVVEERHARAAGASARGPSAVADGREPDDPVVRRMHLQHGPDAVGERRAVVADACPVRRADLDELRAGRGHDVGDAELPTDLDQLAARDEHLLALRERGERQSTAPRHSCSRRARRRRR